MRIKTAWSTLGKILLIVVVTALFVYPFWWMVVNSLNTAAQVFGKPTLLPVSWRWENYKEIFQIQPFGRHLFNSILVALIGTTGNVIISALSGYAFARIRFPGREALFILRGDKKLCLIVAAVKQTHREKLSDRQHLTGLIIITEVTGALTVCLQISRDYIFIV